MPISESDRRLYPRVEVNLPGKIHVGEQLIDCVVKDLSSTGAGLLLAPKIVVTGAVELQLHSGHRLPAQVYWRSGPRCGLMFDNFVVFSPEPPETWRLEGEKVQPVWWRRLYQLCAALIARPKR